MSAALLYGLVILSAVAHAVWNAMMKSAGDRTLTMVAIRTAGLMLGLCALPFVGWPAAESWKWLGLTTLIQFGYYALLIRSYGVGDMSVVYPLARGIAPVLTALLAAFLIGEELTLGQVAAVGLISLGIAVLSLGAGAGREAVLFALATGVAVAAYSFTAGMGVRAADSVLSFQAALEIVNGAAMVLYGLTVHRHSIGSYARHHGARGLLAGAISVVGFLAFLAAAQALPLGPVVALRETSVIFGAVLGTFVLREAFGGRRIVAASAVVLGIAMLALWR